MKFHHNLETIINQGITFSAGEEQLIALAKIYVKKNKDIFVIDEATAQIDPISDKIMNEIINQDFQHSTIIKICHKMDTVLQSDYVIIMDKGEIIEQGEPSELISNENSIFNDILVNI